MCVCAVFVFVWKRGRKRSRRNLWNFAIVVAVVLIIVVVVVVVAYFSSSCENFCDRFFLCARKYLLHTYRGCLNACVRDNEHNDDDDDNDDRQPHCLTPLHPPLPCPPSLLHSLSYPAITKTWR